MMAARLRTDFWVAALRRRAEAAGAFISIARRGADEAGTVFVVVDRRDGSFDLYGPAPQSVFDDERPTDRLFSLLGTALSEEAARARMEQEMRFDPDLWQVDIEDREGRAFVDLAPEEAQSGVHRPLTMMLPDHGDRANTGATWLRSCRLPSSEPKRHAACDANARGEVVIFPGIRVEYHDQPPTPPAKQRQRRGKRSSAKDALSA